MSKKVYIDEDECVGCGSCEEICSEVFELDENTEKAGVIKESGGPDDLIQEAIDFGRKPGPQGRVRVNGLCLRSLCVEREAQRHKVTKL